MRTKLQKVLVEEGLVSPGSLDELRRWGFPVPPNPPPSPYKGQLNPEIVVQQIEEGLQERVPIRETDLDAYQQFKKTCQPAVLVLQDEPNSTPARVDVLVGRTYRGDILIPWEYDDDISLLLTNGLSHIEYKSHKMFFKDVRDLYHGEKKTFVTCTPSTIEPIEQPK